MTQAPPPGNLLQEPAPHDGEIFEDILRLPGIRIERIVSHGETTPPDQPYIQSWDEWVLILEGTAELTLSGTTHHILTKGDHVLIPANTPHLVTYTANPTIWLAVHVDDL